MTEYDNILTEQKGRVGIITLNRPEALNALNSGLMADVVAALTVYDADPGIGAIILTGSSRAFAAGADIKEMSSQGFIDMYLADWFAGWDRLTAVRKPIIAAVAGFALGGGCEVAMMCDILIAADTAKFGQPEIKLGIVPGAGGTQRLPRAIGKAKAMDMILTGRMMDAAEAERSGLVSRVVPADQLMTEALAVAEQLCGLGMPSVMLAKDSVNRAFESGLTDGIAYERRVFHSLFGTADQQEGMDAFLNKRKPEFKHR